MINNFENTTAPLVTETKELSREDLARLLRKFNGRNEDGSSKVIFAYQSFELSEDDESSNKNTAYSCDNPAVEISLDTTYPGFFTIDIAFRDCDDPELKLLWGRLQRHKRNLAMEAEKDWIFYIQLMEKASITQQTVENDMLWTCNIFNPELFFLTREVPNLLCTEIKSDGGLYGGNVIRMLVPAPLVSFDESSDIDTQAIKNEVLTEDINHAYINTQSDNISHE